MHTKEVSQHNILYCNSSYKLITESYKIKYNNILIQNSCRCKKKVVTLCANLEK